MRHPIGAGRFYADTKQGCLQHLQRVDAVPPAELDLPERLVAAIVPHAGWDCSGQVAMRVYRTVAEHLAGPATFVLFGSVHSFGVPRACLSTEDAWETPLGPMRIDRELTDLLLDRGEGLLLSDGPAHAAEHSIEVQLPMIRYVFGDVPIVAVAAPPRPNAHEVGRRVAEIIREAGREAFFVGTTDLTHYGRLGYGFAPAGPGRPGLDWAKRENDPRMIDLMEHLAADRVVDEARTHHNACGSGAVACTLGAARAMGAERGYLVEYTTSYDVLRDHLYGDTVGDFVGYAGMVF